MAQDSMKKMSAILDETANTITHLENLTIRKGTTWTLYYLFYGNDAPYAKHLQVFGKLSKYYRQQIN